MMMIIMMMIMMIIMMMIMMMIMIQVELLRPGPGWPSVGPSVRPGPPILRPAQAPGSILGVDTSSILAEKNRGALNRKKLEKKRNLALMSYFYTIFLL